MGLNRLKMNDFKMHKEESGCSLRSLDGDHTFLLPLKFLPELGELGGLGRVGKDKEDFKGSIVPETSKCTLDCRKHLAMIHQRQSHHQDF